MAWLIQIFVPLYDNEGKRFGEAAYAATRDELIGRFGGLTAYQRAPAHGLWKTGEGQVAHDDLAVFEVMADALDREWWTLYRQTLQARFRQDVIVARATALEML